MSDQVTGARNEWMTRVLGMQLTAPKAEQNEAAIARRLTELVAKAKALGASADVLGSLREGGAALKDGNVGRASELLQEIETRLASTPAKDSASVPDTPDVTAKPDTAKTTVRTSPALVEDEEEDEAEEIPEAPPSPKAMADAVKPQLKLRSVESARELAVGNLEAACRAMLRTTAFEDDDTAESDEVQAAIDAIGERVPDFVPVSAVVQDALAKLSKTPSTEQAKLVAPALAALAQYRQALDAEPLLREMENSDAGSFAIHSALTGAVDELSAALSG